MSGMKRMFESIEEDLIEQGNPAPSMQEIAAEYEKKNAEIKKDQSSEKGEENVG